MRELSEREQERLDLRVDILALVWLGTEHSDDLLYRETPEGRQRGRQFFLAGRAGSKTRR